MPGAEALRFTDILTTASAVANYVGERVVRARHVREAVAILRGERRLEDLGRPVSPLLRRATGEPGPAEPSVRELAQRWFAALGHDLAATISDEQLARFLAELEALEPGDAASGS